MKYRHFGRKAGLRVSELALGTGNFGTGWGHGAERDEARKIFDRYAEAGGNFIDTANGYQFGQSETLLGDFLAAERDRFVLATKYTMGTDPKAGVTRTGNSRFNMARAVEDSLRRLKTDRIDLYWAHIPDGATPIEEILRGFDDLTRAGKILYGGLSNFPAWRVARGAAIADLQGWAPLAGIQIEYSLAERSGDRELLPMAEALGLGVAMWSPLGGGFLTGKYRAGGAGDNRATKLGILVHGEKSARETAILDALQAVAKDRGATPTHIAIAWLLYKAAHSSTGLIPILGSRSAAQLDATLDALKVALTDDQAASLDAASAIPLGIPHQQIREQSGAYSGGDASRLAPPAVPAA